MELPEILFVLGGEDTPGLPMIPWPRCSQHLGGSALCGSHDRKTVTGGVSSVIHFFLYGLLKARHALARLSTTGATYLVVDTNTKQTT